MNFLRHVGGIRGGLRVERHGSRILQIRERDLADGYHPPPDDPVLAE